MHERTITLWVGLLMLAGIASLMVLAFKVSGLTLSLKESGYSISATFDNIGGLKVRSPVTIAGVRVGQVTDIQLNKKTFQATVTMKITAQQDQLPEDTAASILTAGLLGANYINLTPGFRESFLKDGGRIENTHSALILENLIGQLVFSLKSSGKNNDKSS